MRFRDVDVLPNPVAQSEPRVVDTSGFAAHNAALKKENLYYNNFVILVGHMVPISAETGFAGTPEVQTLLVAVLPNPTAPVGQRCKGACGARWGVVLVPSY